MTKNSIEPLELSEKQFFSDLLLGNIQAPMKERLLRFSAKSLLDIGCGAGRGMLLAYYVLGIERLIGFDLGNESNVLDSLNDQYEKAEAELGKEHKPIDSLEEYWSEIDTSIGDLNTKITDHATFRRLLNLHFGMRVQRLVRLNILNAEKFDAIICSQVFHFMDIDDIIVTLRLIEQHRHQNSLIYLSAKTGFTGKVGTPSEEMMERLMSFAKEQGLRHYKGPSVRDGQCQVFTNI